VFSSGITVPAGLTRTYQIVVDTTDLMDEDPAEDDPLIATVGDSTNGVVGYELLY
ncbi:hypothetical protein HOH67_02760, partial [Candidatus Peregrinibacteria bacterium]|nr:hypothetical protein [Candidatus Peregrinibacteria bacterium]